MAFTDLFIVFREFLPEVGHGQAELVPVETGLAPAVQRLLVRRVELNHLQQPPHKKDRLNNFYIHTTF